MTDHQYRTLPRICNSDLSELQRISQGAKPLAISQTALDFGTAFHTLILEPEKCTQMGYASRWNNEQYHALCDMRAAIMNDSELVALLNNSERETVRLWTHPATGLLLKGKLDAVVLPRKRHLIDLKTTSCTTKQAFIQSIVEYNYDRQAAFYLSSDPDAEYFEFVGVCKVKPYPVFRVALHRDSEEIRRGRRKMDFLLQLAKLELDNPGGWVPSAWSRNEEEVI